MWWPVQYAWGITYPNITTAVVEIMIAKYSGTSLSKNIGSASKHSALAKSKVESNWWWLFKIYKIGFAIFFSSSLPELAHNYI